MPPAVLPACQGLTGVGESRGEGPEEGQVEGHRSCKTSPSEILCSDCAVACTLCGVHRCPPCNFSLCKTWAHLHTVGIAAWSRTGGCARIQTDR